MKKIWLVLCTAATLFACKPKDYIQKIHDPGLYSQSVFELNKVVMGNNFSPIVASRNYLYANIAAYECIAAGYPTRFNSLAGQVKGLDHVARPDSTKKIDFELASLLAFCSLGEAVTFPQGSMKDYTDSIKSLARDHGMPDEIYENTVVYAKAVAQSILDWSRKDHYLESRSAEKYTIDLNDPARWQPTPPAYTPAMEPHWASIRTLVLDSASEFRAPPPPAYNVTDPKSPYYRQVMLIKNAVDSLTPEQQHMAEFWDDNPFKLDVMGHVNLGIKKFSPPGHWMSIVGIAARKAGSDYPTTVYAYAKTAIALFDSFIQCWDTKFQYNTARPETVINKHFDPDWRPFLQTPPFPEYTCGHSTISAAAATVLTDIYGDHFSYTDTSELKFGIPSRQFASFRAASEENNWARFYGGIHFHSSCIAGSEYGRLVGNLVNEKLKMKKT